MLLPNSIRTVSLFCAISFLSACDNGGSSSNSSTTSNIEGADIVLAPAGVGPINGKTPFNIHQITIAFQQHDYHVEQVQTSIETEGESYPVIRVSKDTDALLLINPTMDQKKIFSIVVKDDRIGNALGHKLGATFGSIYSFGSLEQCTAGAESLSGKVLCYAPKSGNILYMFADEKENNFPDGKLPPADALDSWKLTSIIWKPKR